jgi:tripartite-type tricarboxylate transporter receptor subunit TctC
MPMQACMRRQMAGALLAACLAPTAVPAQDTVAQFYAGKQISLIVGSTPGGGYDLYGRLVARVLGKYIPGNPSVLPANKPGAGSIVLTQYIYSTGPKDGTAIGAIFPGAIVEPLLGDTTDVKYDSTKLNYIGSANSDAYVCIIRSDAPVKSFSDAFSKEVVLGASGGGGSTVDFPTMLNNVLGTKFRIVRGYPGSNEISLAIENKEVQGTCGVGWSTITTGRPHWLKDGFARVIAQENLTAHPDIAKMGVPLTISFAKTAEQRQIMDLIYAQPTFGRPYIVAPEVPPDRVAALRKAFAAAMRDPELLAEAGKIHLDVVDPMSGADLQALVARLFATPPDIVAKTKQALVVK